MAAAPLLIALACSGSEFAAQEPDATAVGAGGSAGAGSSATSAGGSNAGAAGSSAAGTGGGTRDAGRDGGGGSSVNSGDCEKNADCGGDPCVELYPGGYRVCAMKVVETTTCSTPAGQCCKGADCRGDARASATCVLGPIEPSCGGPAILATNVCASDACAIAADCPGAQGICAPAGTLGRKAARCLDGGCRLDSDCTTEPGGICVPVASQCCADPSGLFCLYHDGCRSNADCKPTEHCATDASRAYCAPGAVLCPAVR